MVGITLYKYILYVKQTAKVLKTIRLMNRDKAFEPSRDRRQMDEPNAKGRRPDYFMELILPGLTCYLMVLEAKKSRQTSPTQTDTEKVANLLKDSIDHMARAAVDVNKIKLFGLVVVGKDIKALYLSPKVDFFFC